MKQLICLLALMSMFVTCSSEEERQEKLRNDLFGRSFKDTEVQSIELIQIDHPMLGGVTAIQKLDKQAQDAILYDISQLKRKGLYICRAKFVIRFNLQQDTLRLKACNTLIANRFKDVYYASDQEINLIEKYWNP
jgi:hypothetical protein